MKNLTLPLLVVLLAVGCRTAPGRGDWISLFNGKDLDGWSVQSVPDDAQKVFWSFENGTILCDSLDRGNHDYVWLTTTEEYGDCELKLRVQTYGDSPGNSGVQIRSRYDHDSLWLDGPQVDIHPPGPWRTGCIYDETRGVKHWIAPLKPDWRIEESEVPPGWQWLHADEGDGWNDMLIRCEGTSIKTLVNGVTRFDYDGTGVLDDADHQRHNVGMKGNIALQLHMNDELRIRFKDVYIRKL
jgi:hypothetical protein